MTSDLLTRLTIREAYRFGIIEYHQYQKELSSVVRPSMVGSADRRDDHSDGGVSCTEDRVLVRE